MASPSNVLVVYADQWRAQALGYAGDRNVQTPNLDRFAGQSLNCRQAVSGCPVCCPARASLLTGLYPHQHGIFLNDAPLSPELPSMGKVFAAAGYRTAWVGKWHVDGHGRYTYIPPERRQGFQYFKAVECTHLYNKSRYYDNDDPTLRFWDGYDAFAQAEDLMRWMGAHREKPFLAVLSWGPPHNPYDSAPEQFRNMYSPQTLVLRENVPADVQEGARKSLAGYYAHCTALDDAFGRILRMLDQTGLSERTIVLFLSDHGDFVGSHGLWDKQGPWDEAVRVPFLLRAPGLPKASQSDVVIDQVDILPTLCGLVGLEAPAGIAGQDLAHHLANGTVPAENSAILAAYSQFGNWPSIAAKRPALYHSREFRGLRTTRYTYVQDLRGPWLLYDNQQDPCQQRNLIGDPVATSVQEQLAARLQRRLRQLGDAFLPGPEYVRQWSYPVDEHGTIPVGDWVG